jgi:hypothetical protein
MCESCGMHSDEPSAGRDKEKKGLGVEITYCIE